jgi:hypothetical protein
MLSHILKAFDDLICYYQRLPKLDCCRESLHF